MSNLLNLIAFEDLQKVLVKQRECSDKAKRELGRVTDSTTILYAPDGSFSETTTNELIRKVTNLLKSYATLPTLSEFVEKPALMNSAAWGGSFGVATVVGTVMLKTLTEFSEFPPGVVKPVFIKVLGELFEASKGTNNETSIMERVMENLSFTIKDRNGVEIIGEQRERIIRGKIALLLELMAKLMEDYKMIETSKTSRDEVISGITSLGVRVFLHLKDIEAYVTEIEGAYKKLAEKKKMDTVAASLNRDM